MGMNWWVEEAYSVGGSPLLLSWIFWVIASITLHELAHGVVAIWNGDNTPRELGHMTLNPIVHMGIPSLLVFAIAGIAWGQMPTDPSRYRRERLGQFTVAFAGPATNLILSFLTLTSLGVCKWMMINGRMDPSTDFAKNLQIFLAIGGSLNLLLAAFNMLPVPPLDGSRVLGACSREINAWYERPEIRLYGMIVVLVLFFSTVYNPMQRYLTRSARDYTHWVTKRLNGGELPAYMDPDNQ